MLKSLEKVMQTTKRMAHFTQEKVFLPNVGQYVPKKLDWRIIFPTVFPTQEHGDCYSTHSYRCLQDFGELIGKELQLPYDNLMYKDFRNTPDGGRAEIALQTAMLQGIYGPRCSDDLFPSFGKLVPLTGYLRIPPMDEEFFIRALAQQPVLCNIYAGPEFKQYNQGVFRGETQDFLKQAITFSEEDLTLFSDSDEYLPDAYFPPPSSDKPHSPPDQFLDHVVTAVAYDEETITLRNSWGNSWGIAGDIVVERGHHRGVNELYSNCLMPVMSNQMTDFNMMLLKLDLGFTHHDLSFGPKDMQSILYDTNTPVELKECYIKVISKFWSQVK